MRGAADERQHEAARHRVRVGRVEGVQDVGGRDGVGRDLEVLAEVAQLSTTWLVLGGTALYLGGHALFKAVVWRIVPWSRLLAVATLAVLLLLAPHVSALVLGIVTFAVVIGVAVADRSQHPDHFG